MPKVNAVLVLLKREVLEQTLNNLNRDNVNLVAILADGNEEFFQPDKDKIPRTSLSNVEEVVDKYRNALWLLSGYVHSTDELSKMKNFLVLSGVPEGNIINFDPSRQVQKSWLANLRYVEKNGADFFATGNEYMQSDLDFKHIPCVHVDKNLARGGVNLSYPNQDLRQSCMIAKHVFEVVKPGTIRFVLIGLTPESFRYDNLKDFSNPKYQDARFMNLLSNEVKNLLAKTTADDADPNFESVKKNFDRPFSIKAVLDWEDNSKPLPEDAVANNVQILKYYISLCLKNGAKPMGVIFPLMPAVRKLYDAELLKSFYKVIHDLEKTSEFTCVDLFDRFDYDCFGDITHLNSKGMKFANSILALKLQMQNLLPAESFCDKTYKYFVDLSKVAPKDEYNALMDRTFKASAQRIRRKDKIKIGFVMIEAAQWCGDDLYNYFARDERFETTVFMCMDFHKDINDLVRKDFQRGVEQIRSTGAKVVPLDKKRSTIPPQDVIISLTPYLKWLPRAFKLSKLKPSTLITHIPYGFDSSYHVKSFYSLRIFLIAWKVFFSSTITFDLYKNNTTVRAPRGLFSGYPRMDIFFHSDTSFHFDWKMTRPDAKKIIWAPHHSIKGSRSVQYATFQWNHKFMYEFAKAHPEISWVVKPHPWLLYTAITEKVFPSVEALKEYLQKWNELPNALVYTGGYYQAIFATGDGMIHDCGSFTSEYQYMDKPMIYLTRDTQRFNKLGDEILKASYLVDGKDFDGIAALIKQIFIDGQDPKADKRRKVFDKYLNYPKYNGMLASEFIYKSIAEEFR